ncbi:MAG: hypothetical protein R3F02_16785 [Thiolinea sp.]
MSLPVRSDELKSLPLTGVNISARVLLQGPFDPDTGLMSDQLRIKGVLPVSQPYASAPFDYSGAEQLSAAVSAADGQDAIVDWVLLELRDAVNPAIVVAQQAVALQRDGDLVEPQTGGVVMNFASTPAGNYRVSVRHRNHLGIFTAAALPLSTSVTVVDFSSPSLAINAENARYYSAGFALLWSGDSNQDQRLIAVGVGNDSNPLLEGILLDEGNSGFNVSYQLTGYLATDFNLDGRVIYSGPGNDNNLLLVNVLSHPENAGFSSNFIVSSGVN